jgi:hypothetical protein
MAISNMTIRIRKTLRAALAFLVCCALGACSDALGVDTSAMGQSDFYGGWMWEDSVAQTRSAYNIAENAIIGYTYNAGGASATFPSTPVIGWTRIKNPNFGQTGDTYPEGFKISLQGGSYFLMYLHTNKQSLLRYEATDIGVANPEGYRIYAKKDLNNQNDNVPKRIKITGFPATSFEGGQRGAMINVIDYLNRRVATAATTSHSLMNSMTFQLKKPDTNEYWTETGAGYTVWFYVFADTYNAGPSRSVFIFTKANVTFSGAEVEIPFTPENWTVWDLP